MTTSTLAAEPGRRVIFSGFASSPTPRPGVITGIDGSVLLIRLDGARYSLRIDPELLPPTKHLHLLNEVGPVPALPMGCFLPTASLLKSEVYEDVPVFELEDDVLVALADSQAAAVRAVTAYMKDHDYVLDDIAERLEARWVVFEWQPEDAEYEWLMNDAAEGDELAVRAYYLPF